MISDLNQPKTSETIELQPSIDFLTDLKNSVKPNQILTSPRRVKPYATGIKIGSGKAEAVILPQTLVEMWQVLKTCVAHDKIIIMQAANTGVTAGSTPYGDDYDRDVVIINTLKIDNIILLNGGTQVLTSAGATLYQLENKLANIDRSPHSIIGSSCIGASIVGGISNNSGGNLVNRGPAYTELSLFAQVNAEGELELVNHLGIDLGNAPETILDNLDNGRFDAQAVPPSSRQASDHEYCHRVREVDANTPARFNADKRRLFEASGCAGKLAVFAVRLDTFEKPDQEAVFYIGTNDPTELTQLRKHILTKFDVLPEMGEYMHRSYFDASAKYCKDSFLILKYFGTGAMPKLWALKRFVDSYLNRVPFLPNSMADRSLQVLAALWPKHLPKRIRNFRDRYEHHLVIKANDEVISATRNLLENYENDAASSGSFFECSSREAKAAILHRFVAGNASGRFNLIHAKKVGGLLPFDIALRRDDEDWHNLLPPDLLDQLAAPLCLSHFFCLVIHHDFVVKKGVDPEAFKSQYLKLLDERGAKYPAEHNVGHLYKAEPDLSQFYQTLDPTNTFNSGVGKMPKTKHYA